MKRKVKGKKNLKALKAYAKIAAEQVGGAMAAIRVVSEKNRGFLTGKKWRSVVPEPKDDRVSEFGSGIFVTGAMMNEVHKDAMFPGKITYKDEKEPTLTDVVERLDQLERLIKSIFNGHVLINGRFRKITP